MIHGGIEKISNLELEAHKNQMITLLVSRLESTPFGPIGHMSYGWTFGHMRYLDCGHLEGRTFGVEPFGLLAHLDCKDVRTVQVQMCVRSKCPNSPNVFILNASKVQMGVESKKKKTAGDA